MNFKADFPALAKGLVYLDNASTTQKPQVVIDAVNEYNSQYAANVHRGIYATSERASAAYEKTRDTVRAFIGAASTEEIIFTSGTTESINTAAKLLAQDLQPGDQVIVSRYEHHANLIPWQIVQRVLDIEIIPFEPDSDGLLTVDGLQQLITPKTKILALTAMSNVTGYVPPITDLIAAAHEHNLLVVLDAAQYIAHQPLDVQALDADVVAFSAHKLFGPTGVGVLYAKKQILESHEPVDGGGSMIDEVTMTKSTWAPLPLKFEPGTPNIAGVIGFGAALDYLRHIGMDNVHRVVEALYQEARTALEQLDGVTVYGANDHTTGVLSFTVDGIHPHDIASVLDQHNIAVRAGHHCAQPLMQLWDIPATVRASFTIYNTSEDIAALTTAIQQAQKLFG